MSARREKLLDLAEHLLERDGLEAFGMGALAREAGIRTPSLYKHFSGATDLEHALISRGFRWFAVSLESNTPAGKDPLAVFAEAYRAAARSRPQLYRLMTERPLDREQLNPGAELAAMSAILAYFGESEGSHDRARTVWAAAHGLVSLELANRFPPGADLDAAWRVLVETFEHC